MQCVLAYVCVSARAGVCVWGGGIFYAVSALDYARESIHESIRAIYITPCE